MWWNDLTNFEQIVFIVASSATIVMLLFLILMIIGIDGTESFDGGLDVSDLDGFNDEPFSALGGLKVVTVRGVLAFFSIGGWTTYLFAEEVPDWLAVIFGAIAGTFAMILLAYIFKQIYKLESSGNIEYQSAIGKTAVVYLRIPKSKSGTGKVIMNHQERMVEVDAITEDAQDIMPKTQVEVVRLDGPTTLVVKIKN
ncbi:NfeD family protein [Liberiplasma polymorphum]|uniref:NfeD family protein n=1 Tax=Liberiplasma polymorphum TaxID=3374570 RepID=UPI0037712915